jgi:hypothetical protein
MMASGTSATLDRDETASLIASDKVESTPVYGADGKRVGKIERLMIDKSGWVAYAVKRANLTQIQNGERHVFS